MPDMEVRLARPGDDAAIADLLSRVVMPGAINISCRYRPSFFSALEAEGYNPQVLVGEQAGRIAGVGSITTRKVYLYGTPAEVGYLASLRIDPEIRSTTLLARGYHLLGELHARKPGLPFSLTSIMRNNHAAIRILTSGKAGLPRYRFLAGYKTAVIPVLRRYAVPRELTIVRGDEAGMEAIFHICEQYGRQKNFFPVHDREEVLAGSGLPKGLRAEDFLVAFRGSEPVGCLALWDQSSFRKLMIREYSAGMRIAGMVDRAIGKVTGAPLLPVPGQPFAPLYLSSVAVKDNDPTLFRAILSAALNWMRQRQQRLLVAGFFENDLLCRVIDSYIHIPMFSNIYTVSWDEAADSMAAAAGGHYLDVGSL